MTGYLKNFLLILLLLGILLFSCRDRNKNIVTDENIIYQEKYRPQFHFSPEAHWMNDPNGLVFLDGEYHLFYQYYPDSTIWGPMHWGHAVSTDLIHWQNLPIALYPDSLGYIFSGSAVVDTGNTSGLGSAKNPAMIAIFTYHNPVLEKEGSKIFQNEGLAYSVDKGRTWIKYPGNPVLKNPGICDFRDPKVSWDEITNKWIMILAVHDRVHLYSSLNLLDWKFESEFGKDIGAHGGVWECPDLFRLKVKGSDITKWIMFVSINPGGPNGGSATQYFTGNFTGHEFVPDDTIVRWVDWGRDDYAGVTWSGIPEADGRRLFIGWMSNWNYATSVPTTRWRSANTVPRELFLENANNGYQLISKPLDELEKLREEANKILIIQQEIKGETKILTYSINLMQCELKLNFNFSGNPADSVGVILENDLKEKLVIGYSQRSEHFYIDRSAAGNSAFSKNFSGRSFAPYEAGRRLKMHLLIDASSLELFVDDGRLVMTELVFPREKYTELRVFSGNEKTVLDTLEIYGLKSIWKKKIGE